MLSAKPWKLEGLMRLFMCLLGCIASLVLLSALIQHFTGAKPDDNTPALLVINTLALDGSILLSVFIFLRLEHISWAEAFGFKSPGLFHALMWGLILALFFVPIGQGLNFLCARALEWVHVPVQNEQAVETMRKAAPGFNRVYLVFFAIVIAPLAEETLFRGILYPSLKQYGYPRAALWATSLLFALIHLNLSAFLPLTLLAIALAILYEKTNNLLACILAHSFFNVAGVLLLYLYPPGAQPPY